jgi:diguanylate cyclase (GGDEF)-like protein
LLICRDAEINKWGRRWLEREGAEVAVTDDPAAWQSIINTISPDVVVVESGLAGPNGRPLVRTMSDAADFSTPIIALTANARELKLALECRVFDIVRRPYEWRLLGRRARVASHFDGLEDELANARESMSIALDVAERARKQLRSHQSFEPLTGLPNKKKFVDLLRRGMQAVDRDKNVMAVFVVGFNRFRLVVEALGQDSADLVLTEIGKKLGECLQEIGTLQSNTRGLRTSAAANIDQARFAIMLTCSGDQDELAALQQELVDQFSRPVQIAGQTVYLSACVGVALYPGDASDVDSLLQRADNAMRDAQSRGGGFKFYCTETDAAAARKLRLEHMIHEALNESQLSLAYQPIVDAKSGTISAAEALLRWEQEDGTFISPAEFVPVAEESGLMIRVGEFVLEQACRQLHDWQESGVAISRICVNVSRAQLIPGQFAQTVRRVLKTYRIEPGALELELSERGVLSGNYEIISQLHEIKNLGVRLSIDDFGTGDSAIAYLKELPVDVLKIDRSYIDGLTDDKKDAAIVSAMVALGHSLDLEIVAEGIETRDQLDALRALGCDQLQGFFLARPVDERLFEAMIKKQQKSIKTDC